MHPVGSGAAEATYGNKNNYPSSVKVEVVVSASGSCGVDQFYCCCSCVIKQRGAEVRVCSDSSAIIHTI